MTATARNGRDADPTDPGDWTAAGECAAGEGTLIPMGEKHWCENRTDEPCTIVCALVKRGE